MSSKTIIEVIQEDDPSFDPLKEALKKSHYNRYFWKASCDRIYIDGYYGPVSNEEWKEQDGRKPYSVSKAKEIVAKVLDEVGDYYEDYDGERTYVSASDIKAALVPFWKEIYGYGYPSV